MTEIERFISDLKRLDCVDSVRDMGEVMLILVVDSSYQFEVPESLFDLIQDYGRRVTKLTHDEQGGKGGTNRSITVHVRKRTPEDRPRS